MSTTQPSPPKSKATVDDIVQQLTWLNQNVGSFIGRYEQYLTTMHAQAAAAKKHRNIERAIQAVLCGIILLLSLAASEGQTASGNLAELTAQTAATTKTIVPSLIAVMASIGLWRALKSPPTTHS